MISGEIQLRRNSLSRFEIVNQAEEKNWYCMAFYVHCYWFLEVNLTLIFPHFPFDFTGGGTMFCFLLSPRNSTEISTVAGIRCALWSSQKSFLIWLLCDFPLRNPAARNEKIARPIREKPDRSFTDDQRRARFGTYLIAPIREKPKQFLPQIDRESGGEGNLRVFAKGFAFPPESGNRKSFRFSVRIFDHFRAYVWCVSLVRMNSR